MRKKNFRLLQEEQAEICVANPSNSGIDRDYLIDEDGHFLETEEADTFGESEEESKSVQMWNNIELETKEHLKVPYAVYQQMTRTYRLKNYPILRSEDFDILDMEDGEFNTKYSRVPGWNHIFHLIEYNNEGLLPDNNNLIAKLKLTVEGKMKFLTSRKIPLDTPFEEYKNEYMEYRNQFFKEEAKKWQNMPLNTFEDFRKQLQLLTHMYGKNDKIERGSLKYSSQHKKGDKIEILDTSDEDSLFELTLTCDDEFTKSDLFVRLEKLSCDIVDTKLRQDSGYYDYSSSSDMENVEIVEGNGENLMGNANVCSEDIIDTNVNKVSDVNDTDANKNIDVNSSCTSDVNPSAIADKEDENNFDARSVLSDHNYCGTPLIGDDSAESKSDPTKSNQVLDKTTEEIVKKPLSAARVHPKVVSNVNKAEEKIKRKINVSTNFPPLFFTFHFFYFSENSVM